MECRPGCGACCIAPSISSSIPGMESGKPAGVKCIHLTDDNLCKLFGKAARPAVCSSLKPSLDLCGNGRQEAIEECLKELNYNEKNFPPKSMLELIGKAKDELMEPAEYIKRNAGDFRMNKIGAIYELYQRKLRRNNAS